MATNGAEGGTSSVAADPEPHWMSNPGRGIQCNSDMLGIVMKTRTEVNKEVDVDTAVVSTETQGGGATDAGAPRPGPRPDRLRFPPATPVVPAVLSLSIASKDLPAPHDDRWCEGPTHVSNVCSVLLLCLALLTLALYAVLQCVPAVTEGEVNLKFTASSPHLTLRAASPRSHSRHSPPPDSLHSFVGLRPPRPPPSPPSSLASRFALAVMVDEPNALLWLGVTPIISAGAGTVLILAIIYAFSNLVAITCKWRSTVRRTNKLSHSMSKYGSSSRRRLKRCHLERCCCGRWVTATWQWYFYIKGTRSPYFYVRHENDGVSGGGGG